MKSLLNNAAVVEELAGLAHIFEPVPATEPVSFEMESLRRVLSADTLDHRKLSVLIYEIAALGKLSMEWKTVFELAYEKIPLNKRIYARAAMMFLHYCFEDSEAVAKVLPVKPYTEWEIAMANWVEDQKGQPRREPHRTTRDPADQVAHLLASVEREQRERFNLKSSEEKSGGAK